MRKILKEINGFYDATIRAATCAGFAALKDDGSTTCASWIYSGVFPAPDKNLAGGARPTRRAHPAHSSAGVGPGQPTGASCTTAPRPIPKGKPWSEKKKWVWWDAEQKKWTGYDVPDYPATKPPTTRRSRERPAWMRFPAPRRSSCGRMASAGCSSRAGLVDGPLPTHYEPAESPVKNPLYKQQTSPVIKYWKDDANPLAAVGDPKFPYVMTTYRLTEHYLAGAMSRWIPWLTELQPELFVEISPELAAGKRIKNLDWVKISSPRGTDPRQGSRHPPAASVHRSTARSSTRSACRGTGATRGCHGRRRQRADRTRRRSERVDSRGQGLRVQRGQGLRRIGVMG